jgi:hypothetical protein
MGGWAAAGGLGTVDFIIQATNIVAAIRAVD